MNKYNEHIGILLKTIKNKKNIFKNTHLQGVVFSTYISKLYLYVYLLFV